MELSTDVGVTIQRRPGLGRCRQFFWLGVVFDTVGVAVLFTGVFADLLFYDLLLYLGSIIIFLSLLWWVFWYTGNIEMPPEENLLFGRPFYMHSSTVVEALRQSVSHRFSLTLSNISNTFMRIRKRRRRALLRSPLDMTVTGQLEKEPEKEDEGTVITENVKESSDAQDFGRENLALEPEDGGNSEAVFSPGSDAHLPRVLKRAPSQLVLPVFTESLLDQPPGTSPSPKELIAPADLASKSQPAVHLSSATQPPAPCVSTSQPAIPIASQGQLQDPVLPKSQPLVLEASQSQFQNLAQASAEPVQASQTQALGSQVSLMQLKSHPSFPTVFIEPQVSQAVQDSQTLSLIQQTSQTSSLLREISPTQSSTIQEFLEPIAEASETLSLSPQKLPDTPTPPSVTAAPVTQAQQSVPPKSAPASAAEKKNSPL